MSKAAKKPKTESDGVDPVEQIRVYRNDLATSERVLKEKRGELTEKMENTDASTKVARLRDQLTVAQEDLRRELRSNQEVNDLMEEVGAQGEVVRAQKRILSDALVAYYGRTGEHQVEIDSEGHSVDLILSAKLGKEEKQYQTSLLNQEE